jgi:hypothetical protein
LMYLYQFCVIRCNPCRGFVSFPMLRDDQRIWLRSCVGMMFSWGYLADLNDCNVFRPFRTLG